MTPSSTSMDEEPVDRGRTDGSSVRGWDWREDDVVAAEGEVGLNGSLDICSFREEG